MKRSVSPKIRKVKSIPSKARLPAPDAMELLTWYDNHRRILPWRALPGAKADPYTIWLSEIMLQQTTVGAVGPYYRRFVNRWPTVQDLARARLSSILKMWAGLGYYRRAHLLHECAKTIVRNYGGQFPQCEAELIDLPGFGLYTSAAVAAIAFDQPASVVDGNVERVMARLHAVRTPLPKAKPELRAIAKTMLPAARYGDYAQALMDLGATICTPRSPKCDLCPWKKDCRAHAMGIQEKLPMRMIAKEKPIRRAVAFFAINDRDQALLARRPKEGLLGGMMEIPSSEWRIGAVPRLSTLADQAPVKAKWDLRPGLVRHVFSHFTLEVTVAFARVLNKTDSRPGQKWVALDRLKGEALPSLMRKIVRHAIKAL